MTTMIDEILEKGLGHDDACITGAECDSDNGLNPVCTCGADKRRKYLERLREPTPAMVHASCKVAYGPGYSPERVCEQDIVAAESELEAMLKAAEEGL